MSITLNGFSNATPPVLKKPVLLLFLVSLLALASAAQGETTKGERTSVKLLTVGNSFAWNATSLLPKFAEAGNKKLAIFSANLPGRSLQQHAAGVLAYEADPQSPDGRLYADPKTGRKAALSLQEALKSDQWDYVTIQQASHFSFKPETYEPHARILIETIRKHAPQAEILIHQTWAYREDHPMYSPESGIDQKSMHQRLRSAYEDLAARYKLRVIPVGDAFQALQAEPGWKFTYPDPDFNYESPAVGTAPKQPGSLHLGWIWPIDKITGQKTFKLDAIHLNLAGKYLAGAVFYEVLFGSNVEENIYVPKSIETADAAVLRRVAHATVSQKE